MKQIWLSFVKYINIICLNEKKYILVCLLYIINNILLPLYTSCFPALVIDSIAEKRNAISIVIIIVGILALGFVNNLFRDCAKCYIEKVEDKLERKIKFEISRKMIELDLAQAEDKSIFEQVEKAKELVKTQYEEGLSGIACYAKALREVVQASLFVIISTVLICRYSISIGVVCITSVIVCGCISRQIYKLKINYANKLVDNERQYQYLFHDLTNAKFGKDIKVYQMSNFLLCKEHQILDMILSVRKEEERVQRKYYILDSIIGFGRLIYIMFTLYIKATQGKITIGNIYFLISISEMIIKNALLIFNASIILGKGTEYIEHYMNFLNIKSKMETKDRKINLEEGILIEFKNVSFKYPKAHMYILKGINVSIQKNEHIAIVGLNGTGKSTFIKLLCRLYDVTEGVVQFNGHDVKEYSKNEYWGLFSMVFQDFNILAFSLRENLGEINKYNDNNLLGALQTAGLREWVEGLHNNLDTNVMKDFDEEGIVPSGGQQQKIAFARAIYKDSPIFILDEPTSALDPVAEQHFFEFISKELNNKTAIFISHRLSSCMFADRIFVFNQGRIVEIGNHDVLMKKKGTYYNLYMNQAKHYE